MPPQILISKEIEGLDHLKYSPPLRPAMKKMTFANLIEETPIFLYFCAYPFQTVINNPSFKMKNAEKTVRILIQLDADDIPKGKYWEEDDYEEYLTHFLNKLEREPIANILDTLRAKEFIVKGGAKNEIFPPGLMGRIRQRDITLRGLNSQLERDSLLGYRYEKGDIPTTPTGKTKTGKITEGAKSRAYESRSSDFMDKFDKSMAIIEPDTLKQYMDFETADTKDGEINEFKVTIEIDTLKYFKSLFIKHGFGDLTDRNEFAFGIRGDTEEKKPDTDDKDSSDRLDIAEAEAGYAVQADERDARNRILEDYEGQRAEALRADTAEALNIEADDVTYQEMVEHAEQSEEYDTQQYFEDEQKMLKALPKSNINAIYTLSQLEDGGYIIKDWYGKTNRYKTMDEVYAKIQTMGDDFTSAKVEDWIIKTMTSKVSSKVKDEIKAFLTPANNKIDIGTAKIIIKMKNWKTQDQLVEFMMGDKHWGSSPFSGESYKKAKNEIKRNAEKIFPAIIALEEGVGNLLEDNLIPMLFSSAKGDFKELINSDLENIQNIREERKVNVTRDDVLWRIKLLKHKLDKDLADSKKGEYEQEVEYERDADGNLIYYEYREEKNEKGVKVPIWGRSLGSFFPKEKTVEYEQDDEGKLIEDKEGHLIPKEGKEKEHHRYRTARIPDSSTTQEVGYDYPEGSRPKPISDYTPQQHKERKATQFLSRFLNVELPNDKLPTTKEQRENYHTDLEAEVIEFQKLLNRLEATMRTAIKDVYDEHGNVMRYTYSLPKWDEHGKIIEGEKGEEKTGRIKSGGKPKGKQNINWGIIYLETGGDRQALEDWIEDFLMTTSSQRGGWRDISTTEKELDIPIAWVADVGFKKHSVIDTRSIPKEGWRSSARGKNPFKRGTRFGDVRIPSGKSQLEESSKTVRHEYDIEEQDGERKIVYRPKDKSKPAGTTNRILLPEDEWKTVSQTLRRKIPLGTEKSDKKKNIQGAMNLLSVHSEYQELKEIIEAEVG